MFPFFLFLFNMLNISFSIESVIWSKTNDKFVPLFNISSFFEIRNTYLKKIRELENHNFQNEILIFSYYLEPNLVTFTDNNTKISGVCGEIWTTLADYLNFTLVPLVQKDRNYGIELENGSYDGLLGLVQQNQSQIIPRSGAFADHLPILDFTFQLWKNRYTIYIRPTWEQDILWVYHSFSRNLWYLFTVFIFILTILGYIEEKYQINSFIGKANYNLIDHLFYTISIALTQGNLPSKLYKKSRIYFCTSTFSWCLFIAFSTHAINHMMFKRYHFPFTDLKSLLHQSEYQIMAFKGSMVHTRFQNEIQHLNFYHKERISYYYTSKSTDIYEKICFSEMKNLAIFESEDHFKSIGKYICTLVPLKVSYFKTWIVSGVKKGYRYKRSFDVGLIKLYETGLMNRIKDRWFDWNVDPTDEVKTFVSIDINQVYLIHIILCIGFILSSFIFMIEFTI